MMSLIHIDNKFTLKQHPLLKQIPWLIWANVFDYNAHEDHVKLMANPYAEAIEMLPEERVDTKSIYCLILAHSQSLDNRIIDHLSEKVGKKSDAFKALALTGKLDLLKHLCRNLLEDKSRSLPVKDFQEAFVYIAAITGHKDTLEYLLSLVRDERKTEVVKVADYAAFRLAAANGHKDILEYLVSHVTNELKTEMVKALHYDAFRDAVKNRHKETVNYLLRFPECLSYAEMHEREYGDKYVHPFIDAHLQALRQEEDEYYEQNPAGVFDIADEAQCRHGFYVLRNLIRRHDEDLIQDINFLLNIPGIKALAHTEVTAGMNNELLRLALAGENEQVIERLLQIPPVRELAMQNNYYVDEMRGDLDLRALALNAESSMTALTPGEKKRLQKLTRHYQADIDDLGQENLFAVLKEELKERYSESPATITVDGKEKALPLDWQDFQALNLTGALREEALKAYYQNNTHSAYRYLSKPNHWMADNAGYVYINDDRTERWASFEEYKPLIVLFFRAAFDDNDNMRPVQEEHDLKARQAHFINELALIGRAHNWDKTRHARNIKTGELLYDENNQPVMEEYDDQKGDKPSCYSGVKRRLFQSLIDHPLFSIIGIDTLECELRKFLREHFASHINQDNSHTIDDAIKAITDGVPLSQQQQEALAGLDVPEKAQDEFISAMAGKYKEAFNQQPNLTLWLKDRFSLRPGITCHVFQFYMLTSFDRLLGQSKKKIHADKQESKGKTPAQSPKSGRQGFFDRKQENSNLGAPEASSSAQP